MRSGGREGSGWNASSRPRCKPGSSRASSATRSIGHASEMRVCLELRHNLHPDEWAARHRRGEVPDRWPYGLDRLANHGIQADFRRPLRGRVPKRIARALRAQGGGFEWFESATSVVSRERRRADLILCWDEYAGVPAIMRERGIRGRPVVTGVVWLADGDV